MQIIANDVTDKRKCRVTRKTKFSQLFQNSSAAIVILTTKANGADPGLPAKCSGYSIDLPERRWRTECLQPAKSWRQRRGTISTVSSQATTGYSKTDGSDGKRQRDAVADVYGACAHAAIRPSASCGVDITEQKKIEKELKRELDNFV